MSNGNCWRAHDLDLLPKRMCRNPPKLRVLIWPSLRLADSSGSITGTRASEMSLTPRNAELWELGSCIGACRRLTVNTEVIGQVPGSSFRIDDAIGHVNRCISDGYQSLTKRSWTLSTTQLSLQLTLRISLSSLLRTSRTLMATHGRATAEKEEECAQAPERLLHNCDIAKMFRRARRSSKWPGRKVQKDNMTDIQLLDEQEVSRRLSVSINTLRYWRVSGDGPNYVKLGRLVRYDALALEKFIERNLRVSKARATTEEKRVAH